MQESFHQDIATWLQVGESSAAASGGLHQPSTISHQPLFYPAWETLPLGVQHFSETQYSTNTAAVLAYVILSMVPALAFYAIAERQLIGGLTTGVTRE